MSHFINLHTHRKPQLEDEIVIRNAFTQNKASVCELPYFLSAGIHPWWIERSTFSNLNNLQELMYCPNVIALGECGIDRAKGPEIPVQLKVLEEQLELSKAFSKPVIMHVVKAYSDLPPLMKKYQFTGIIHGFKGNHYEAEMLIDHGFKLSFGYRLRLESNLTHVFKSLKADSVYLETDIKPLIISDMYELAAGLRGMSIEELKEQINRNFERDFSLVLPNE
ncbi:MAG: TatD family hydrolase [Bacteroidia bacterium]